MLRLGRNPACIIPAWREFLRDAGPGPVVGVGEPVWPGRSDAELVECSRHESLLNLAFDDGRPWRLLCPYDTTRLAPATLEEARRNHPHVDTERSHSYTGPRAVLARDDALAAPARRPTELPFGPVDLRLVRDHVVARARSAGFAEDRLADLLMAVNELVANSLRHAGGRGVLRMWEDDRTFFCEVADHGRIDDPLVGRERPSELSGGGRGLWIVNHLCDLVQVRSTRAGTVIRAQMTLA